MSMSTGVSNSSKQITLQSLVEVNKRGLVKLHLDINFRASNEDFTIKDESPTRTFSWLKPSTSDFTFKTLLRHYARQALTHGK